MKNDKKNFEHLMDTQQLLDLLKTEKREEESIRSSIRTTMNIYVTMLVTILGGLATLVSISFNNLNHGLLGVFLILGGIIVFFVALAANKHYISGFRRQAETIVQEAKLENLLGIDDPSAYPLRDLWEGESLIPESFLKTRKRFQNSSDFVNWFLKETDTNIARVLYLMFMIVGIAIIVIGMLIIVLCLPL